MARLSFWESAGGDVGLVRIRTSRGLLRNPKIRIYRKKSNTGVLGIVQLALLYDSRTKRGVGACLVQKHFGRYNVSTNLQLIAPST
jgi:hypothetical protein